MGATSLLNVTGPIGRGWLTDVLREERFATHIAAAQMPAKRNIANDRDGAQPFRAFFAERSFMAARHLACDSFD